MGVLSPVAEQYRAVVDTLLVYTLEAHATDEWPIRSSRYEPSGAPVAIEQHRTAAARLAPARRFRDTFRPAFPVLVDPIDDRFEKVFATWPFRFYVLSGGSPRRVLYRAQPTGGLVTYALEPVIKVLDQLKAVQYGAHKYCIPSPWSCQELTVPMFCGTHFALVRWMIPNKHNPVFRHRRVVASVL